MAELKKILLNEAEIGEVLLGTLPGVKPKVKLPKVYVGVDKIAEAFGISERKVQRLVIYEGLPRKNRGAYDLYRCISWYIAFLHAKVCGCAGPCNGFDPETRNATNARAERMKALKEITELAPDLVGLKAEAIREILAKAVEQSYEQ